MDKRPVYNGYSEVYLTGQDIIEKFSDAYECYGQHHERTTAYKMDWSYKKKIKPEKVYRIFINDNFCAIFDGETDKELYFFGYTFKAPAWAKEGKKPPAPKYCQTFIERTSVITGEKEQVPIDVICDNEGNILTDLGLLKFLYDFRFFKNLYATNKALVSMATFKPQSKDEFIGLPGLWEGTYKASGEQFIKAIQFYIEKEKAGRK